ncbi:MAG: ketoacyl-ACP synthase III [Planctomycetaceae bacterium]|nr:ketoacyl-ACP synthase III [Planctomycetaceae bacterium]
MKSAQIHNIEYYLPEHRLSNEELSLIYNGWTAEKMIRKLGIRSRAICGHEETAVDMGEKAVRKLFDRRLCTPEEIDFLVFCTQSPDYLLPTSACLLQNRLGIPTTSGALDFNLGCSGYIYGLAVCRGLIETGAAQNVLLVTSETYSRYINPKDRVSRPLFGDGASVTLIRGVETEDAEPLIGPFVFGTDGSGAKMLIVPAGGHRIPCSAETAVEKTDNRGNVRSQNQLYMHGQGIFAFAIERIPPLVNDILQKSGKTRDDIDCYIFHQANKYMLDRLQELCSLAGRKYFNDILDKGNTVSSSVPIAMVDASNQGLLCPDDTAMLVGFGVGLSWGAALVKLPRSLKNEE